MKRHRQAVRFGYALFGGCLILIAFSISPHIDRLAIGENELDRTDAVISALDTLQGLARDEEIKQRAFLISGDEIDLRPFAATAAEIETGLSELASAIRDDPRRTRQFATLRGLLYRHQDFLAMVAATRRESGFEAAREFLISVRDLEPAAELGAYINNMRLDARRLVAIRGQQRLRETRQMQALVVLSLVLTSIAAAAAFHMRSEIRRWQQSEEGVRALAERAVELKNRFLASVSHELRTPLNAIIGWAHVLKIGAVRPPDTAHAIDAIERNALAQTTLITQLLDLSHMTQGRFSLAKARTDLRRAVDAAVRSVSPMSTAKGLILNYAAPPSELIVMGDEERLEQIASHLMANAVKFTPSGGSVDVALTHDDGVAKLSVRDTGEGIDADLLPHVFEPFSQGHTRAMRRGAGLGLALVKELVDRHCGTVTAHSKGPGKGSTFTVRLPIATSTTVEVAQQPT
jgi:signal transduction histidine kinase